jgi:hypothetical protein
MLHSHECGHCSAAKSFSGEAMVEKSSVRLPGTVEKIIQRPGEVEKAEISVEGADPSPNGEHVRLKEGAEVEVTVQAGDNAVPNKPDWRTRK